MAAVLLGTSMMSLAACSPEEFAGANEAGLPVAADYAENFKITVDQETNYANFTFEGAKGVTPVWIIDGAYTSTFGLSKYYRKKGVYSVECKVKNANGISDGSVMKEFEIEKTKMTGFAGFVEDSEFNLFKGAELSVASWYYAPGWTPTADPSYTYQKGAFTVSLPEATTDQWQAQMHVTVSPDLVLSADKTYDFSMIITSTMAHPGITVKVQQDGNDKNYIDEQRVAFEANEPKTVWFSNKGGVDISKLKFAFDFGGNAAGTDITLESFVIKDHANDDGTVVPEVQEPEPNWVAVDSDDNLWKNATYTNTFFYANADWSQRPNPELTIDGNAYQLTFPDATEAQWQNQFAFLTDIAVPDVTVGYDFCVVINSNNDLSGVTVKLVQSDEADVKHDNNFFFAKQVDVTAGADYKFYVNNVKAPEAMHAVSLVFDFGGNPANTEVLIKDIIFQTHRE